MSAGGWVFHCDGLALGYADILRRIRDFGHIASPRGKVTRELLAVTIVMPSWEPMLPAATGRGVSVKLAAIEALQVIGGFSDPAQLLRANPNLEGFMDNGEFHGAYGPRIGAQLEAVVRRLSDDPQTRRAIISLWDPRLDDEDGFANYPCKTELQFMARAGALDLHVTMRANDAWHGLAYDAFVSAQLLLTVARIVGMKPGTYYHHASSLHLYAEHVAPSMKVTRPTVIGVEPRGLGAPQRARDLAAGGDPADDNEDWWAEMVARVR